MSRQESVADLARRRIVEEEESAMRNRRRELDLGIKRYNELKVEILPMVGLVRQGQIDDIQMEKLETWKTELDQLRFKMNLNLKVDVLKYNNLRHFDDNLDTNIDAKLVSHIETELEKNKLLLKKIEASKELLANRNKINEIIKQYLKVSRVITLSKEEILNLFGKDLDVNLVTNSGRLLKENKDNENLNEYEFTLSSNSFRLSCERLTKLIETKIQECDHLRTQVSATKEKWETISKKLFELLDAIQTQIEI